MKKLFLSILISSSLTLTLTGCMSSASGLGMAVGQQVGGAAVNRGILHAHASGLTCEEIEADIASREKAKINPLSIPSINRQIAQVEAVAREKGCPGYTDTADDSAAAEDETS